MLGCIYKGLIRPALFQMDPESAHDFVHKLSRTNHWLWPVLSPALRYSGKDLACEVGSGPVDNPIGLAAGFDKNGYLLGVLGSWGFGFAEIGSITARPSNGNPKPRLFRLPEDAALINRMGLNGEGAEVVARRLAQAQFSLPVGINIAKTNDPGIAGDAAIEDILFSFRQVKDLPVHFVTINASCPNTAEGRLEEKRELAVIFEEIRKCNSRNLPVYVKLSPDSSSELIEDIVEDGVNADLSGFVCGNTSTSRSNLLTSSKRLGEIGNGGLSGRPLKAQAMRLVEQVYKLKKPHQKIIAVGGIATGTDAYDFICNGANAVELYTAMIYEGPTVIKSINQQLSELLKRDQLTLSTAVGAKHR